MLSKLLFGNNTMEHNVRDIKSNICIFTKTIGLLHKEQIAVYPKKELTLNSRVNRKSPSCPFAQDLSLFSKKPIMLTYGSCLIIRMAG